MPEQIEEAMEQIVSLVKAVERANITLEESKAMIVRLSGTIDVAFDAMMAVAHDETAEWRVRRRLIFALKQMAGLAAS